jgi:hypothetical protein
MAAKKVEQSVPIVVKRGIKRIGRILGVYIALD